MQLNETPTFEQMPDVYWSVTSLGSIYKNTKLMKHPNHSCYTIYLNHFNEMPIRVCNRSLDSLYKTREDAYLQVLADAKRRLKGQRKD
jgi:hypothetical protein